MTYSMTNGRLTSTAPLSAEDFETIAKKIGYDIRRKIGFVAAVKTTEPTRVITYRKGKETENIAQPGDFIVTNLVPQTLEPITNTWGQPDQYVIRASRLAELYDCLDDKETEFGTVFKAKSIVKTIYFPKGFDIVPPWSGRQIGDEGYLFLNGSEVYGCEAQVCHQTYEVVDD